MFKRQANMEKRKQRIADLAADFIKDHQTIFIDSSSTCMILAKRLMEKNKPDFTDKRNYDCQHSLGRRPISIYNVPAVGLFPPFKHRRADACEYISRFFRRCCVCLCRGIAAIME